MKSKLKSYSFWMSVSAGLVLLLNNFGKAFGFVVESEAITEIVDSICGILVLFGVITMPKNESDTIENDSQTKIDGSQSSDATLAKTDTIEYKEKK